MPKECLFVYCQAEAVVDNRLCLDHYDWARYELADPKYMTEEPPPSRGWKAKERSAIAPRLLP